MSNDGHEYFQDNELVLKLALELIPIAPDWHIEVCYYDGSEEGAPFPTHWYIELRHKDPLSYEAACNHTIMRRKGYNEMVESMKRKINK